MEVKAVGTVRVISTHPRCTTGITTFYGVQIGKTTTDLGNIWVKERVSF
jgi:hypothetical protein